MRLGKVLNVLFLCFSLVVPLVVPCALCLVPLCNGVAWVAADFGRIGRHAVGAQSVQSWSVA